MRWTFYALAKVGTVSLVWGENLTVIANINAKPQWLVNSILKKTESIVHNNSHDL